MTRRGTAGPQGKFGDAASFSVQSELSGSQVYHVLHSELYKYP